MGVYCTSTMTQHHISEDLNLIMLVALINTKQHQTKDYMPVLNIGNYTMYRTLMLKICNYHLILRKEVRNNALNCHLSYEDIISTV
jgi:hypothetical protein